MLFNVISMDLVSEINDDDDDDDNLTSQMQKHCLEADCRCHKPDVN